MSQRLYICFLAFFIGWFSQSQAQEEEFLDNSVQEVHGLHTIFFITPTDVKFNRGGLRPVIHTIQKIDLFTYRQRFNKKIQDLSNNGTAAKNIFYTLPKRIGFHTGFQAYDIYFHNPLHQPYYDTKAPYTDGTVIFANYGSYSFEVTHARSFNKNWHAGATFESMLTDREFIPSKIPYDRQVITYPITLFGRYASDNDRYQIMFSFYRKNHRNRETGGIANDSTLVLRDWLKPKAEIRNNLASKDSVENSELRQQYFLYHEVKPAEPLQLYHQAILTNNFNQFTTEAITEKSAQFLSGNGKASSGSSMSDSTTTQSWANELGIKGQANRVFYQYYYRNNKIDFQRMGSDQIKKYQEHYLGTHAKINIIDSLALLHVHGEYLQGDFYKIRTSCGGQWGKVSYDQIKHQVPQVARYYNNTYRKWKNHFSPPLVRQLEGSVHIPIPYLFISPYSKLARIKSPIYYRKLPYTETISTAIEPLQASQDVNITTWGTNVNLTFLSYFHVDTDVASTEVTGPAADVFRIPAWYTNVRAYYADNFHEGKANIETGIEFNWKSDYKGDAYDPITQQFFVQDNFLLYSYPIFELFFNYRIKTFRGFVKMIHLNQGTPVEGYFVTPFYPGELRSIDLGVSWSLFD